MAGLWEFLCRQNYSDLFGPSYNGRFVRVLVQTLLQWQVQTLLQWQVCVSSCADFAEVTGLCSSCALCEFWCLVSVLMPCVSSDALCQFWCPVSVLVHVTFKANLYNLYIVRHIKYKYQCSFSLASSFIAIVTIIIGVFLPYLPQKLHFLSFFTLMWSCVVDGTLSSRINNSSSVLLFWNESVWLKGF